MKKVTVLNVALCKGRHEIPQAIDGYIFDEAGLDSKKIEYMVELRDSRNDVVEPYAERFGAKFFAGRKPWELKVDIAMPCATQIELNKEDAKQLVDNGVKYVAEVSNMGCTPEAIDTFIRNKVVYGPGKAVNAGVRSSGLNVSTETLADFFETSTSVTSYSPPCPLNKVAFSPTCARNTFTQ